MCNIIIDFRSSFKMSRIESVWKIIWFIRYLNYVCPNYLSIRVWQWFSKHGKTLYMRDTFSEVVFFHLCCHWIEGEKAPQGLWPILEFADRYFRPIYVTWLCYPTPTHPHTHTPSVYYHLRSSLTRCQQCSHIASIVFFSIPFFIQKSLCST